MKQKMSLPQYLKLGGKLENINWDDAKCTYYDENRDAKIGPRGHGRGQQGSLN